MPEKISILNIKFDNISLEDSLKRVKSFLKSERPHQIVTPNPEFLLEANKNHKFTEVLNNADLSIPDGIGILWAAKLQDVIEKRNLKSGFLIFLWSLIGFFAVIIYPKYNKSVIRERVTGSDLMISICENINDIKIFLLGAKEGIAKKVAKKLDDKYKNIKIAGYYVGSPNIEDKDTIIELIKSAKPDILFVAFSFPRQDIWISENLHNLPSLKVAMGVGGSFDFIAGEKKRSPKFMQKIGIEWLYRLFLEPKNRFVRIFNAVVVLPFVFIKSQIKQNR